MYYKINWPQRQRGISLIELMISLAIGLILLWALAYLMITASNSAKQRSTSELLDEQSRQIFSRLESDLYRAGFVDSFADDNTLQAAFNINDNNIAAGYTRQLANIAEPRQSTLLGRNSAGAILPLEGFDGTNPAPAGMTCTERRQCLQVAYQALGSAAIGEFSSVANADAENASLSGASAGCNGNQATDTHPILINRYEVGVAAGENNASLRCSTNRRNFANEDGGGDSGAQPIIAGVEQLVFRYLVTPPDNTAADDVPNLDTTISGRSVSAYLTANEVLATPLQWAGVVGVEICAVVAAQPVDGNREVDIPTVQPNTPSCLRANNSNAANDAFAPDVARANGDLRLYRRYVRTIILPNSQHLMN